MGRVTTVAVISNLEDLWMADRGMLTSDAVRRIAVPDALVDTGAMILSLPTRMIQELGLKPAGQKQTLTAGGPREATLYQAVRLTVMNRDCTVDVLEVPDSVPVLIGQVPLEILDLIVDPPNRCLVGNPAHGGQQMVEVFVTEPQPFTERDDASP